MGAHIGDSPTVFHALLNPDTKLRGKREEDVETLTGIGTLIYAAAVEVCTGCSTNRIISDFDDSRLLPML
jgi:hypothetical protein